MSKIALSGNASGTGTLTIAAPNTSTDRTLTLPDAAGTLDRLERAGNVLQVVQFINTTDIFTTSTSLVATGFIGSITPSSSTNKILFKLNGGRMSYASTPPTMRAHLYRKIGTGSYADITNAFLDVRISSTYGVPHSFCYLDSPSTTNEVSYQAYFYSVSGDEVRFDSVTNTSLIMTLMEIAA